MNRGWTKVVVTTTALLISLLVTSYGITTTTIALAASRPSELASIIGGCSSTLDTGSNVYRWEWRPLISGIQLYLTGEGTSGICSAGFPAYNMTVIRVPWDPVSPGADDQIRPELVIRRAYFWLVTAGHCAKVGYDAYQPTQGSEYYIGDVRYSSQNNPGLKVDALLIYVSSDTAWNGYPNTDKLDNKTLVLKFQGPDIDYHRYTSYRAKVVDIDHGEQTFRNLYKNNATLFKAGRTTGYVEIPDAVASPDIVLYTFHFNGMNIVTYAVPINYTRAVDPCNSSVHVPPVLPGDSGGVIFRYLGDGNLTDPKPIRLLGTITGWYEDGEFGKVVILVPISKTLERFHDFYGINLKYYYGDTRR